MSVTNINATSELTAASELRAMMQGRVVLRGDDDYAQSTGNGRWISESLAPLALPGGYANFLVPWDREQTRSAYGSKSNDNQPKRRT